MGILLGLLGFVQRAPGETVKVSETGNVREIKHQ